MALVSTNVTNDYNWKLPIELIEYTMEFMPLVSLYKMYQCHPWIASIIEGFPDSFFTINEYELNNPEDTLLAALDMGMRYFILYSPLLEVMYKAEAAVIDEQHLDLDSAIITEEDLLKYVLFNFFVDKLYPKMCESTNVHLMHFISSLPFFRQINRHQFKVDYFYKEMMSSICKSANIELLIYLMDNIWQNGDNIFHVDMISKNSCLNEIFKSGDNIHFLQTLFEYLHNKEVHSLNIYASNILRIALIFGRYECMLYLVETYNINIERRLLYNLAFISQQYEENNIGYYLNAAIIGNNIRCVKYIFEKAPLSIDEYILLSLQNAAQFANVDIFEYLLISYKDINKDTIDDLLAYAFSNYQINNVKLLLTMGSKYRKGITARIFWEQNDYLIRNLKERFLEYNYLDILDLLKSFTDEEKEESLALFQSLSDKCRAEHAALNL